MFIDMPDVLPLLSADARSLRLTGQGVNSIVRRMIVGEGILRRNGNQEVSSGDGDAQQLVISGLDVTYGHLRALKEIDLTVAAGEFVALLGPSGCGKTSLLRAVAGFVSPSAGAIRLHGRDLGGSGPRERNIGIVFQSYALFPHMTARDNVAFGLRCRRRPAAEVEERTQEALRLVGLSAMADRRPRQLSGGQQQRVALARAIVIEPDLLLLDEPLGALDKQLRVQMQSEIKGLQSRLGITTIMVTHDQEEAMSMADRVVVMKDGVIEQVDAPARLFANPRTGWVADFVSAGSLIRGDLRENPSGGLEIVLSPRSRFEVRADAVTRLDDHAIFVPAGKIRISPSSEPSDPKVVGRRFFGIHVEVAIAYERGIITTLLDAAEGAAFPLGHPVTVEAEAGDCRLLAEG
ncbi:MAG: ABC transporter ATP-binding protein [Salinarimonas sp.]